MLLKDFLISDLPEVKDRPYPHFQGDNLFNSDVLDEVIKHFPDQDDPRWKGSKAYKLEMGSNFQQMPEYIKGALEPLMSEEFCDMLSNHFKTPPLIPIVLGAGIHISLKDTNLPFYIDWQKYKGLYRWLNIHIYLNKNIYENSGGEFIMTNNTLIKVPASFNKTVCYYSSGAVRHGHPNFWELDEPCKCLSMYYFSEVPSNDFIEFKKTDTYRRNRVFYGID